jgi:hypothetical protein
MSDVEELNKSQGVGQKEPAQELLFDKKYTSKANYELDPNDNVWNLSKDNPVSFNVLSECVSADTRYWIKKVLVTYVDEYSAVYLCNIIQSLVDLYKTIGDVEITDVELRNFRSTLDIRNEWKLGAIVAFLNKWKKKGYPGITADAIEYLKEQTLKGSVKGEAVQLLDPEAGPLSDIEVQALHEGLNSAYHKGAISTEDYAAVLLQSSLGSRSAQITKAKIKDMLKGERENKEIAYFINMPRAKNGLGWRDEFSLKSINELMWDLLEMHSQDIINSVLNSFPSINKDLLSELPLFPNWDFLDGLNTESELVEILKADIDVLHVGTKVFGRNQTDIIKSLNCISERTGEPLHINPRRFRYTLGTNLGRDGISTTGIAEALDHADTQNAGIYTKNNPEVAEAISKAVDLQLIPLAQAFAGNLIDSEKDAVNGNKRNKRIRFSDEDNNISLATCGEHGYCSEYAPVACYTCSLFQPWVDAPHEVVLNFLLTERDRIAEVTNDARVTTAQDRSILAVKEVIKKCDIRKQEKKNKKESIGVDK